MLTDRDIYVAEREYRERRPSTGTGDKCQCLELVSRLSWHQLSSSYWENVPETVKTVISFVMWRVWILTRCTYTVLYDLRYKTCIAHRLSEYSGVRIQVVIIHLLTGFPSVINWQLTRIERDKTKCMSMVLKAVRHQTQVKKVTICIRLQ